MCGIFGYIGNKNEAARIVLSGLKMLEYRGYDSWGIAVRNPKIKIDAIIVKKRVGKIGNAKVEDLPESSLALGHTRWATHGGVTQINAHPHLDCNGNLAIIHNGIIENYDVIKNELITSGHKFKSQTDTEVAVHLLEEYLKKSDPPVGGRDPKSQKRETLIAAVRKAFNRFEGLNAIIVMDAVTDSFVAVKNGSPLVVGKGTGENLLASDAHAILSFTKNVYFIEDDEIVYVDKNDIAVYECKTGERKSITFNTLSWKITSSDKGSYHHFMLKEIADQRHVIAQIVNDSAQAKKIATVIKKSFGTYLVGCGSAAYACLAGTYLFSKIAKFHVNFSVGSEFGYLVDFLTNKSFIVALSQSGETIDVIDAVKKARAKGATIGCLVNVLGSTLYRVSDYKLLLGAGVETAVVSTKAFSAKIAYLLCIAHHLCGTVQIGIKELQEATYAIDIILKEVYQQNIQTLSQKLSRRQHIFVIGRGLSYPIALETALKIKETSYIHAEGFAAGELKHGVIALIEKGTPCIAFLPNDETYGATLAGVMELKARGGFIIGVSYKNREVFDRFLHVLDCGNASLIPNAVIGQLLGYHLAVTKGLDPDKPRNLAKSVTVK